jgi:hypothetical protein
MVDEKGVIHPTVSPLLLTQEPRNRTRHQIIDIYLQFKRQKPTVR